MLLILKNINLLIKNKQKEKFRIHFLSLNVTSGVTLIIQLYSHFFIHPFISNFI